jgi:GrpB-like predicted nucleotidyltransferase (UPF0157 family)
MVNAAAAAETHVLGRLEPAMSEPLIVVPYDAEWPRRFDEEGAVLSQIFAGSDAAIEHVGRTAVPGLGAKPVIDIMAGVSHLAEAEARITALEAAGYLYVQKHEAQLPERRYFRKPRLGPSAYHLHCVVRGSDFWVRLLAFRDYLRAHPESAAAYYALKRELAVRYRKSEYTDAKSPFIEGVLVSALSTPGE